MSLLKKSNKRILEDIKNLVEMSQTNTDIIHSIEICDINVMGPHYVCLKGPKDTPYENGLFVHEKVESGFHPTEELYEIFTNYTQ